MIRKTLGKGIICSRGAGSGEAALLMRHEYIWGMYADEGNPVGPIRIWCGEKIVEKQLFAKVPCVCETEYNKNI